MRPAVKKKTWAKLDSIEPDDRQIADLSWRPVSSTARHGLRDIYNVTTKILNEMLEIAYPNTGTTVLHDVEHLKREIKQLNERLRVTNRSITRTQGGDIESFFDKVEIPVAMVAIIMAR